VPVIAPAPAVIDDVFDPATPDGWVLTDEGVDPLRESSRQSRTAISNGFLGIRAARTLNRTGGVAPYTCVAGLFDVPGPEQPVPQLMPAADWLQLSITSTGHAPASALLGMSEHRRRLDLSRGVLHTGCQVSGGQSLGFSLRTMRLISLADRRVGLQLMRLEIERGAAELQIEAWCDGLQSGLLALHLGQDEAAWRTRTSGKGLGLAAWACLETEGRAIPAGRSAPFRWSWVWQARPGKAAFLQRLVGIARTDEPAADPAIPARQALAGARSLGWRAVLEAHAAAWSERWRRSDVVIEGDPEAQGALRFAAYHLNSAANPDDERVSVAARALTGSDYHGHVFWDTEIFLLPFYSLIWPQAARAMLMYRFHTLDAARVKATRLGWRGALYAWESADTGAETTPEHAIGPDRRVVDILCGTQEQHIAADIAYAVWQYWQASADEGFLRTAGAEILLETARFWVSRAVPEADGCRHIRGVIGPDEYHEHIDDNAFTNMMARHSIARALEAATLLKARWPDDWARLSAAIGLDGAELSGWPAAASAIVTGRQPATGLYEQFAGYFALEQIDLAHYAGRSVPMDTVLGRDRLQASQIVKQADVVGLLALLPEAFPGAAAAANFAFYAPRCSHGSSLSRAMHGVAAARLGLSDQALTYFRQTAAIDLADSHAAIDGGIHIAALGGVWLMAIFGFAGVSLHNDHLAIDPILPPGWIAMSFPLQWHGSHLAIRIDASPLQIVVELAAGAPVMLRVCGELYCITEGKQSFFEKKDAKMMASGVFDSRPSSGVSISIGA